MIFIQLFLLFYSKLVIQNRLEELIARNHQPFPVTDYEPYRLLSDMKEEQDRNEKALLYLRRRLLYPDRYRKIIYSLFCFCF